MHRAARWADLAFRLLMLMIQAFTPTDTACLPACLASSLGQPGREPADGHLCPALVSLGQSIGVGPAPLYTRRMFIWHTMPLEDVRSAGARLSGREMDHKQG